MAPEGLSAVSSVLTRVNRFDIDPRIRSTAAAYPDPALRSMLAAVALRRSYVAGRPTVDTMDAAEHLRRALHVYGTVTLVEKWSGTVGFGAAAMKQRSVVHLSGNDGRGDFPPDREAVSHLGTPFGCGQSVPARPKMR